MIDNIKPVFIEILKFLFFAMCIAFAVIVVILITSMDIHALGNIPENSLTERTQEALLAISILLFAGLLVVLVVSRVLGMRLLVHIISGPYFHQSIKSFLEEGTELLGYMIIFSSSLCYCFAPNVALNFARFKIKSSNEYSEQRVNCRD